MIVLALKAVALRIGRFGLHSVIRVGEVDQLDLRVGGGLDGAVIDDSTGTAEISAGSRHIERTGTADGHGTVQFHFGAFHIALCCSGAGAFTARIRVVYGCREGQRSAVEGRINAVLTFPILIGDQENVALDIDRSALVDHNVGIGQEHQILIDGQVAFRQFYADIVDRHLESLGVSRA